MLFSAHHVKGTHQLHILPLSTWIWTTWLKSCLSHFYTVKSLFSPLPMLCSTQLCSPPLRAENLHALFGILLLWRFVHCPPFFPYSIIKKKITIGNHGYLYCTLSYNPVQLYFVVHVIPALVIGSSFSWLLYSVDIPPYCRGGWFSLSISLLSVLQDTLSSFCVFPAPDLESVTSLRSAGCFHWRMGSRH